MAIICLNFIQTQKDDACIGIQIKKQVKKNQFRSNNIVLTFIFTSLDVSNFVTRRIIHDSTVFGK